MKKYKLKYYLPIAILFLASCVEEKKKGTGFREIKVEGAYLISLPEQMKPTTGLNAEASLQYQDITQEIYLIVLEESKTELDSLLANQKRENQESSTLSIYGALQLERLGRAMKVKKKVGPKKLTIHRLNAELFEIVGEIPNLKEDLYYSLTFIEGAGKVYTVMSWTLDSQKDEYTSTFEHIAKSFELIK